MFRAITPITVAGLLLLTGCFEHVEDNLAATEVPVRFSATVTGRAIVHWSDGVATHTETIDTETNNAWISSLDDADRYVAAITVVPVGKTSKVACRIDMGDRESHISFDDETATTDRSTSTSRAAICLVSGQVANPAPAQSQPVTVEAHTGLGAGRWRAVGRNDAVVADLFAADDERTLHVLGQLHMVTVATKPGDTVTCRITIPGRDGITDTVQLDAATATGLGAIATCHAFITR